MSFFAQSYLVWGISFTFFKRERSGARADDAKIVRSRNAQCKTRESCARASWRKLMQSSEQVNNIAQITAQK